MRLELLETNCYELVSEKSRRSRMSSTLLFILLLSAIVYTDGELDGMYYVVC